MKLYNSFLVRCWHIQDAAEGERRVLDLEHIQTGARLRASSLSEAEHWICDAFKWGCHAEPDDLSEHELKADL